MPWVRRYGLMTRAETWHAVQASPRAASDGAQRVAKLAAAAEAATANVLLASLPWAPLKEVVEHATLLNLCRGDVVERQGGPKRVFFPLSGMLTGVRTREDGTRYAYLYRGREGAVNAIGLARPEVNVGGCDLVTDVQGRFLVLEVAYYRSLLERAPELARAVLSHASHVIAWSEQSADCHGHHPVRARTAYFLLMLRAHQGHNVLDVTHARIAEVLGVRRQSISEAVAELRDRRVIDLDRGRITVRDRRALWQQACDCRRNVDAALELQSAGRFVYTG